MKKNSLFKSISACVLALGFLVQPNAQAGTLVLEKFASKALGRDYAFNVYLPDGYKDATEKDSNLRYPIIYLLHGASGDENDWVTKGSVVQTLDGLIKRGLMRESVVILPGNGTSWWVDAAVDKAETAFMTELIPTAESRYKVRSERSARAIGGLSMGGYGALNLALSYPEKFCSAGIISPAIYTPLPPETSAARRTPQFVRDGKFDDQLWASVLYTARLEKYKAQSVRVPMWIASGDHDFLGIALMSTQLYWTMYQVQKPLVELRVQDGDHEWMFFRDALPDALLYMNKHCTKSN